MKLSIQYISYSKSNAWNTLFLCFFIGISTWLPAQTWVGLTYHWNQASNWNPAQVPTANSAVIIPNNTIIMPNIEAGTPAVAKSVEIGASAELYIIAGGMLTISNSTGSGLKNEGVLYISGTLNIAGNGNIASSGIDNSGTVHVSNNGKVILENNYYGISHSSGGEFHLTGELLINQSGGNSHIGIVNYGLFYAQGSLIKIDRTALGAIKNHGIPAEFTHFGTAELGTVASVGDFGIVNSGNSKFTNEGLISINRSTIKAIQHTGGELTNNGELLIGNLASVGDYGIHCSDATFNNTGHLKINRCTETLLFLEGTNANNASLIHLGTEAPAGGKEGLRCIGGMFTNSSLGLITIENASEASFSNERSNLPIPDGIFVNEGSLNVNSQTHTTAKGINNGSYMFNGFNGKITVGATQVAGLTNEATSEIYNNGDLNFSPTILNGGYFCLDNKGTFVNELKGTALCYGRAINNNILQNFGTMGLYVAQNTMNTGNQFINDGVLMLDPAFTVPNLVNHDLLITPLTGNCASASPALTFGSANSFIVDITWYKDPAFTQPAGIYDPATNTFTQQVPSTFLYFAVVNTDYQEAFFVSNRSLLQANTPLSVTCKNITTGILANGQVTINADAVILSINDNCQGPVTGKSVSPSNFQCNQLGANTVTVTVQSANGNTATCQSIVTVMDPIKPTIQCKPAQVFLNAAGTATVVPEQMVQSITDNCAATVQALANNTFNCSQIGTHTIMLTAKDASGNTATCNAVLTVTDALAPLVACKPATLLLDALGKATLLVGHVLQSTSDNCQIQSMSVNKTAFTCAEAGLNTVEVSVVDASGNMAKCNASVTVKDALAPVVQCKPATIILDAWGQATLSVNQVLQSVSDNCQVQSTTLSKTLFTCAEAGLNTVEVKATDASGNISTCNAAVTVKDVQMPVANCKDVSINLGANGTVTTFGGLLNNGSSDNCSFTLSTMPATLSCANIGLSTVTLRVTDPSGNTATCTAKVTVKDVTAPTALCKNPTIFLDDEGKATLTVAAVNNNSSDACGISTMVLSKTQFNCSELQGSAWPVIMTIKDVNNNTATCTAYVTVKDALAPEAICQNTTVALGSNGKVTVYGHELAEESIDNCSVWSYSPIAKVYTAANLGVNNLTITVKDWSNNAATCVSQVTVLPYGSNMGLPVEDRELTTDEQADMAVSLYPNPAFDWVNLAFQLNENQAFSLKVSDLSGRLHMEQTGQGTAGENQIKIDLHELPAGMYLMVFESAGRQVIKKLVKDRN